MFERPFPASLFVVVLLTYKTLLFKLSPFIHATFYTAVFFTLAVMIIDLIAVKRPDIFVLMTAENHF